jgi:hypothetical protein
MPNQRSFAVSLGSHDGGLAGVVKEMLYSKKGVEVAIVVVGVARTDCILGVLHYDIWGPCPRNAAVSVADFVSPVGYEAIRGELNTT